ncbi:MAG: M28 family peptidase [Pirellulales bacterium]|nr:M28 family peptidase [Pirellulales bacterium]
MVLLRRVTCRRIRLLPTGSALLGVVGAAAIFSVAAGDPPAPNTVLPSQRLTPSAIAGEPEVGPTTFDGKRSYKYLRGICSLGNRMSGSDGMQQQQQMLEKHFSNLGAKVGYQRFQVKHPLSGRPVPMANMIVQWHPQSQQRILLCAHYDTRPLPDRDPDPRRRRQGIFLGANDGASGVALLMELGHHVAQLPDRYGLDFVFFDGEELVYVEPRDPYFLGSRWFAEKYRDQPPEHRYVAGVLFDMVADTRLSLYQEQHSVTWPQTRPIVKEIWSTAQRLGVKEFIPRARHWVLDDHLPLYKIARIPVCNVIDFEYPDPSNRYWHTTDDAPGRCSAASLGKVGLVIQTWLSTKRNAP